MTNKAADSTAQAADRPHLECAECGGRATMGSMKHPYCVACFARAWGNDYDAYFRWLSETHEGLGVKAVPKGSEPTRRRAVIRPKYSGRYSHGFWKQINALKGKKHSEAYALGCALQEAERRLLRLLNDGLK